MLRSTIRFTAGSLSWALVFVLVVAAARVLGPQEFGRFAWAFAYACLFDPILDAGFYRLSIRNVARRPGAAGLYLQNALLWKTAVAGAALAALAAGWLPAAGDARTGTAVGLLLTATIVRSFGDSFRSTLVARGRLVRDVLSLGLERSALAAAGIAVLISGGTIVGFCAAILAVRVAALGWAAFLARGQFHFRRPLLRLRFLKGTLRSGALLAVAGVSAALSGHIDAFIVGALRNSAEVGLFSTAHWTRAALLIVPGVIGAMLIPSLARRHHDDPAGFAVLFGGGAKFACAAGLAITANGLLLAPAVVEIIFGEGYLRAAEALEILLLGLPAVYGLTFLQGSLMTMERARNVFVMVALGLAGNVALSLLLVPRYGAAGAAAATVAAECGLFFGFYGLLRSRLPGLAPAVLLKAPAALVAAGVGAWAMSGQGLLLQVASANATFALALLFFGFFGPDERRELACFLTRRAPSPAAETVPAE